MQDSYTVDVHCARMGSDGEANPIVATLQVDDSEGVMRCQCYVIESVALPRVQEVSCGLFATQCPFTQNLNTNISYGATP